MGYNEKTWSKAFFRVGYRSDMVDNNVSETFNSWILEVRTKPIMSMLEDIRIQVINRNAVKRIFPAKWVTNIAPRIVKQLDKNKLDSFTWNLEYNGSVRFEVKKEDNKYVVDIEERTCSCKA